MKIERGDILMVNLGQVPGTSLQSGIRPVVVVSNNKANTCSTESSTSCSDSGCGRKN